MFAVHFQLDLRRQSWKGRCSGLVVAAIAMSANADSTTKSGFKDLDANGDGKLSAAEVR